MGPVERGGKKDEEVEGSGEVEVVVAEGTREEEAGSDKEVEGDGCLIEKAEFD